MQAEGWVFATLLTYGLCSPSYGMPAGPLALLYDDAPTDLSSTSLFSCLCMCGTILLCCSSKVEHILRTDTTRPCYYTSFVQVN